MLFVVFAIVAAYTVIGDGLHRSRLTFAQNASPQALDDVRAACAADVQRLCAGVPSGGGRIFACLKQHQDQVSNPCKQAIATALGRPGPGSGSSVGAPPAPVEPRETSPKMAAPPKAVPSPVSHVSAPAAGGPAQRYFLMKQAQIDSHALDHPGPAYHLMIPTTWQFKDFVAIGSMKGQGVREDGCFADFFAMGGVAKSADSSIELQLVPQYTWQYIDDPAGQRQMQVQNQRDAQVGLKPCPVRAPIPAAEFLRQDIIAKYRKGKQVVSVDPFPELDQLVRYRLGLPPAGAGGNTGGIRTDAARARLAFDDDKGQPIEEWIAAAIVVRAIPTGGRATAYDWHAVRVMFFKTPKGQLDLNDKLFKLIASTIRPDPEWQKWSNGVIAAMYRKEQEELAKQSAIIAQLQQNVVDTLTGVTARQQAGSMQSAYGVSQGIRQVQTFRDPSSGATFELSNQYDHAWLNGSDQYVMSDDPNFNPNGNLNGNWTQLQAVRPQP
jgi:hypothetical protein